MALGGLLASGTLGAQGPPEQDRLENQSVFDKRLTPLLGEWRASFHDGDNPGCVWRGRWILRGHLVAMECTRLPKGEVEREVDVFGYSGRADRFFMLRIMRLSREDSMDVRWFTIHGDTLQFLAVRDVGAPTQSAGQWDLDRSKRVVVRGVDPMPRIAGTGNEPSPQMRRLADWRGRVPNKHDEVGFAVNGVTEFREIANGSFIGSFEWNTIILPTGRKSQMREVDVWGYSPGDQGYFRLDIVTDSVGFRSPVVDLVTRWTSEARNALLLASPLETKRIDGRSVTSRFGWEFAVGRMRLYEEYSDDGRHWWGRHVTTDVPVSPNVSR